MTPAEIEERFERLRRHLVPVPAPQPGICPVCRSGVKDNYTTCYNCSQNAQFHVVPISISNHGGPLHDRLYKYKRSHDPAVQATFAVDLAVILYMYLENHLECLGGEFDRLAIIPSTQQERGPHNIVAVFRRFADNQNPLRWRDLEARTFKVAEDVRGQRVLLFDDTFTSGVRSVFPAARALAAAGADVRGPLVIGRHFRPEWASNDAIWAQLRHAEFDPSKCARCDGYQFNPRLRDHEPTLFE